MDQDDLDLNEQHDLPVINDEALVPDGPIDFRFEHNEVFNFDITNYELRTLIYENPGGNETSDPDNNNNGTEATQGDSVTEDPVNEEELASKQPATEVKLDPEQPNLVPAAMAEVPSPKSIQCEYCPFETKDVDVLRQHINKKHGSNLYQCDLCEFSSKKPCTLKRHRAYAHRSTYECQICNFITRSKRKINSHLRKH